MARQARILVVYQSPWLKHDSASGTIREISPNFWIVNRRVAAPFRAVLAFDSVAKVDAALLDMQLKKYAKELGWEPDIVEFSSPHFRQHFHGKVGRKKCYWLVDHYSKVPGVPPYIAGLTAHSETFAAKQGDLTIATASELVKRFSPFAQQIRFLPNSADSNRFQPLWMNPIPEPELLKKLKRPIFGYAGNINQISDWKNFGDLVKQNPQYTFTLQGTMDGPHEFYSGGIFSEIMRLPNIHYLGRVPHEELAAYFAHYDVGVVLDEINEFSKTRNQNKMYQYLLSGIPITGPNAQPDYQHFSELLHLFDNPGDWPRKCEEALDSRDETSSRRRREYGEKINMEKIVQVRMSMYEALLSGKTIPEFRYPPV